MIWAGGSDYSVTPYPARYGLWASVARETLAGTYGKTRFGMEESIDIRTALKSYTISAARQMVLENNLRCEMTLVAGAVVFDRRAQ